MDSSIPSNFGDPTTLCNFKGNYPDQLWDQSRPTTPYRGRMFEPSGSMEDSGKGPFSEFHNPVTNQSFWGQGGGHASPPGLEKGGV